MIDLEKLAREILEKCHEVSYREGTLCSPLFADEGDPLCPACEILLVEIEAALRAVQEETREACAKIVEAEQDFEGRANVHDLAAQLRGPQ